VRYVVNVRNATAHAEGCPSIQGCAWVVPVDDESPTGGLVVPWLTPCGHCLIPKGIKPWHKPGAKRRIGCKCARCRAVLAENARNAYRRRREALAAWQRDQAA
jgi:hypothetical protein